MLARELHHNVRNNLQLIQGMLDTYSHSLVDGVNSPESDQRVRAWFSLEVAARLVAERDLAKLTLGAVSERLTQRKVMRA